MTALNQDLFLEFFRNASAHWEIVKSRRYFHQPLTTTDTATGKLYMQGTCLDLSGKLLSGAEVAQIINKFGMQALNRLDGSFVLAGDDGRGNCWCATDHTGTFPLYYKLNDQKLTVTSRAEHMDLDSDRDVDVDGILSFLNSGYAWGDLTPLKTWKFLRPGQYIQINAKNEASIHFYFTPEDDPEVPGFTSPDELLKEIDAGLISLASRHRKLLIPLSGGVDSRLITVRCHTLGIPFECVTYVACESDGDDFAIAARLARIFKVKHHRWEWNPLAPDCIDNFRQLCVATCGSNDAFTSYTDGMKFLKDVSSRYDCIVRGDHSFGMGVSNSSMFQSAYELGINFKDNMQWLLKPPYREEVSMESIFQGAEGASIHLKGSEASLWRHKSRRLTRNPRFHITIGQVQAELNAIGYPLMTKRIVERMAKTDLNKKSDKQIARDALVLASPPEILSIPHNYKPNWEKGGEPLVNLHQDVLEEMMEIVSKPGILSDILCESSIVSHFASSITASSSNGNGHHNIKSSVKAMIKKFLPKRAISSYQHMGHYPKVPVQLIFKRLFATKVFLESRALSRVREKVPVY